MRFSTLRMMLGLVLLANIIGGGSIFMNGNVKEIKK